MPRDYTFEKTRNIGIIAHISHRNGMRHCSPQPFGFGISAAGNPGSPTPSRINVGIIINR